MWRARIIQVLEEEETLKHMASHAATLLASSSGLESRGTIWGESEEGTTQGDPESGPYFSVGMHPQVRQADAQLAEAGGMARFGWDDGYLVGPPDTVFATLEKFSKDVAENCGLELQRSKTEVLCFADELPENTPLDLVRAGAWIEGCFQPGMICYGVPIGSEWY